MIPGSRAHGVEECQRGTVQETSYALTPAIEGLRPYDPGNERPRSNLGATTPKHHVKPGIMSDQKTKPGIDIDNPAISAKR